MILYIYSKENITLQLIKEKCKNIQIKHQNDNWWITDENETKFLYLQLENIKHKTIQEVYEDNILYFIAFENRNGMDIMHIIQQVLDLTIEIQEENITDLPF